MRVAVLGLGRMGAPIAERLRAAGHELSVWNRSPPATEPFRERGIRTLERPSDAWRHADLVITMLANDEALLAVTLGEDGLLSTSAGRERPDGSPCLAEMSTVSVAVSSELGEAASTRGVDYLRAPVTGNPSVVVAGDLGIVVSGPESVFERLAPTLRDIGPNLFYVGDGEQARAVKLALNLMVGGTTQLLAEALVLAERHGLERRKMLEVISGSAIGSPYVRYKAAGLVADDYVSTFTASLLHKDLSLALDAGHEMGVPLPLTAATQQLVESCIAIGMGDLDLSVLVPRLRRDAGG
ncbi:NAD(P)-dependent oxidoreductase [Conexibacter sp. S30A1]|uniref:NAD(P)-dependent oxidoreductase n=1 Tax=Conexibacter sp. S30A1 TaxID=2937800 RepID=UPI00200C1C37|nr:NAD(P)-dependent oxidoreductase [Conexibacter sp. S30A1]